MDDVPEIGRTSRGKYTLLIRYELPTSDRLVLFSVMLNRFHTSSPANVNRKYDGPLRPRAGHDAEREVQHAGGDNRLQDDPRDAQHGLPVAQLDVAPRELEDQVLELDQLVQIDGDPSGGRAQRADRDGSRVHLITSRSTDRNQAGKIHAQRCSYANGRRFARRRTIVFVIDG